MICSPFYGGFVLNLVIFVTCRPYFFYLKHFTFFLHCLVLMVRNTFSNTLRCMFDEIVRKNKFSIAFKRKKPSLTPKNAKFKPWRKTILSWRYFINTMGWIILVQVIGVLFMPKITTQCIHAIPFLGYIKNPLGSITYLLKLKGVLHNHSKT